MNGFGIDYKFCPYCARSLSIRVEEEKKRKYCQACNWTYYPTESIAPVGILERGGKVLLVQRNREPHKGKWMLPSGFKDFGEKTLEALYREMREELGVGVMGTEFIFSPQEYLAACGEDELRQRKNNPALSGLKAYIKND